MSSRLDHLGREKGNTLLLFPSAILVMMLLSAIAVDLSVIHLGRRELLRAASQAADDGAALIDQDAFRAGGPIAIDLAEARRLVRFELLAADLPGQLVGTPEVEPGDRPGTIRVRATMRIEHFFASAVPGAPRNETITVEVTGEILEL